MDGMVNLGNILNFSSKYFDSLEDSLRHSFSNLSFEVSRKLTQLQSDTQRERED